MLVSQLVGNNNSFTISNTYLQFCLSLDTNLNYSLVCRDLVPLHQFPLSPSNI